MCGSATLAMLVSSNSINVAIVTVTATNHGLMTFLTTPHQTRSAIPRLLAKGLAELRTKATSTCDDLRGECSLGQSRNMQTMCRNTTRPPVERRGRSVFRSRQQAEPDGHHHEVGERISAHFAHHLTSVRLDSRRTNAEIERHLFVQEPCGDEQHH